MILRLIFICGLLINVHAQSNTQQVQQPITTKISTDSIDIGQSIQLTISTAYNKNNKIKFPQVQDSLMRNIEVLSNQIDTINQQLQQTITITSFEPGDYLIKTLPIVINNDTLRTTSFKIHVKTIAVDETNPKLAPIKPIIEEHLTWLDYLKKYWIYALVVGAVCILLIVIIVLYLLKSNPLKKQTTPKTPYQQAIFELQELDKKAYLKNKQHKAYCSELVRIWRVYYGKTKSIRALELLSNDLLLHMQQSGDFNQEQITNFKDFLTDSDHVKFAKATLTESKHHAYRNFVQAMVEHLKPIIPDENQVFNQRQHPS